MEPSDIAEKTGSFSPHVQNWIDTVLEGKIIKGIGNIGVTGIGLLFDGAPGIGKTTTAVVAAMEVVRHMPEDELLAAKLLQMKESDYGLGARVVY